MLCSTHRLIHSMHVRYRHGETLNGMGGVSETVVLSNLPYFRRPQHPKRRGRRNQSLNWNNRCWHIEQAHQYTQPSSLLEIAYKKHLHMAAASNIEATHIDCTRKFRQKTLAEKKPKTKKRPGQERKSCGCERRISHVISETTSTNVNNSLD